MEKSDSKDLLNPSSAKGSSSMRFAMLKIVRYVTYSMIGMLVILFYQVYKDKEPDWNGAAMFLGALGVILASALGPKAYQKKNEQ